MLLTVNRVYGYRIFHEQLQLPTCKNAQLNKYVHHTTDIQYTNVIPTYVPNIGVVRIMINSKQPKINPISSELAPFFFAYKIYRRHQYYDSLLKHGNIEL